MFWCSVLPQPSKPCTAVTGADALQAPLVARALITTAVGMAGVRGLLINELITDNDTNPFGVTLQVQQEISSSCGSKVYRLMQIFCDTPLATLLPELVKLTN